MFGTGEVGKMEKQLQEEMYEKTAVKKGGWKISVRESVWKNCCVENCWEKKNCRRKCFEKQFREVCL